MASLSDKAKAVLELNDDGDWTRPSPDVYPHQWLWDSSFSAMGWTHVDIKRAQLEILSLLRGQWHNGMIPHMIFKSDDDSGKHLPNMWESRLSPNAPAEVETSGITQPPVIVQAVHYIGQYMKKTDRKQWYRRVLPHLIAYHEWLYDERDPHNEGLVILVHPWETGLDNTPAWMVAMQLHQRPFWIRLIEFSRADKLLEKLRRDTRQIPADERASTIESLMLYDITRRMRRKNYDTNRVMTHSHFLIEDVFYNSILIRNNAILQDIAKEAGVTIPKSLQSSMNKATKALNEFWDEETGQYYSNMFVSRERIVEQSLATLLPLYAGCISKTKADRLVELLDRHDMFGANYPVPSVPLSSPFFHHRRYWQGPSWLNTNWLIYDGLKRYGYNDHAELIRTKSLEMVDQSGFHEYFSPVDGYGAGVEPFTWTAAMTLVFLNSK